MSTTSGSGRCARAPGGGRPQLGGLLGGAQGRDYVSIFADTGELPTQPPVCERFMKRVVISVSCGFRRHGPVDDAGERSELGCADTRTRG